MGEPKRREIIRRAIDEGKLRPMQTGALREACERFRAAWSRNPSLKDPETRAAAKALLDTAVQWREVAREHAIFTGRRERERPDFSTPPKKVGTFGAVTFHASQYAWDADDGIGDKAASARNLLDAAAALAPRPVQQSDAPAAP